MKFKSFVFQGLKTDDKSLTVEHIISTETRDRDGDVLRVDGCRVEGKPIVTLCGGRTPLKDEPIARPLLIETCIHKEVKAIKAKTKFELLKLVSNMTKAEFEDCVGLKENKIADCIEKDLDDKKLAAKIRKTASKKEITKLLIENIKKTHKRRE